MSDDALLVSEVIIRRLLIDGEDRVELETRDSAGDTPGLVEVLGLLRMAEDTAIRFAMGEVPEDDDE